MLVGGEIDRVVDDDHPVGLGCLDEPAR